MASAFGLSGKVVIVTGGCKGIGRGITSGFLAEGADVVICCRHEPEELPRGGGKEALFVAADVRDVDHVDAVVAFGGGERPAFLSAAKAARPAA